MDLEQIKKQITEYAKGLGASLVGFAPVSRWKEGTEVAPEYYPDGSGNGRYCQRCLRIFA